MRKNVVVIMTDDQGYWSLGCAGNKDAHMPTIGVPYKEAIDLMKQQVARYIQPEEK